MLSLNKLAMALCSFFGETFINSDNVLIDDNKFFPFNVAQNITKYFNFILYVVPLSIILTLALTFKYNKEENIKIIVTKYSNSLIQSDNLIDPLLDKIIAGDVKVESITDTIPLEKPKKKMKTGSLRRLLRHKRIWILAFLVLLSHFSLHCVVNTYRVIATLEKFDINIPKYTNLVSGLLVIFIGPLWGLLADRFSFRLLFIIINILIVISCCCIYFTLSYHILYSLMYTFATLLVLGLSMIINPYIVKIFSMKYVIEIGAVIAVINGLNQLLSSFLTNYISDSVSENKTNSKLPYLYTFCGATVLNVIGIVIGYFTLTNDPFDLYAHIKKPRENQQNISFSNLEKGRNDTFEDIISVV